MPIQKTLALLNNFVTNTTSFFNSFSETVEKRISAVSKKVTELETLLAVLEAKLNSVPDLETENLHSNQSSIPTAQSNNASVPSPPITIDSVEIAVATTLNDNQAVDSSLIPVSEHPDYLPFFKLLKVGVPGFVVQAKVTAAGLDGSMIDTPDKLVSF